jgi:hypothetical protein
MVGMERAYEFHKLIKYANILNQLEAVEYGTNGLQFGWHHNKQSNIWDNLYFRKARESPPNLGGYSLIATNDLALKEGLKEVQCHNLIIINFCQKITSIGCKILFISTI